MSNGFASDGDTTRTEDGPSFGPDLDEDLATRVTRGVADGFAEASHAFSNELAGSNRIPELVGRSLAGVIRANAKLLDEVANVVRDASDGFGSHYTVIDPETVDYDRLAALIAERLKAEAAATASGTV
jgi:hypothetical protein